MLLDVEAKGREYGLEGAAAGAGESCQSNFPGLKVSSLPRVTNRKAGYKSLGIFKDVLSSISLIFLQWKSSHPGGPKPALWMLALAAITQLLAQPRRGIQLLRQR